VAQLPREIKERVMTCLKCQHTAVRRFGTYGKRRIQRYRCTRCSATFSEPQPKPLGTHYISVERAAQVVSMLCEGMSMRAIARVTGVDRTTIMSLLATVGEKCQRIFDTRVRGVKCKRVQCDEIWNFCYAKEKNVPAGKKGEFGFGDVWTWVGIDADTKLNVSYLVARRDTPCAVAFMEDLASRIDSRIQLTTDGLRAYLIAVQGAFGLDVDFATLHKLYGLPPGEERRYSPPICIGSKTSVVVGTPDPDHISTSYIERQNLTMRMQMRRFTRLTNGFSKKIENMRHAVALYMVHQNFVRIHQTLRVTPAMEAGLTDHAWSIEELLRA
jgi:transposase-like protein/IS1 family transposase